MTKIFLMILSASLLISCTKSLKDKYSFLNNMPQDLVAKPEGRNPAQAGTLVAIDKFFTALAKASGETKIQAANTFFAAVNTAKAAEMGVAIKNAGVKITEMGEFKKIEDGLSIAEEQRALDWYFDGTMKALIPKYKNLDMEKIVSETMKELGDPSLMARYPVKVASKTKLPNSYAGYAEDLRLSKVEKPEVVKSIQKTNLNLTKGSKDNIALKTNKRTLASENLDFSMNCESGCTVLSENFCQMVDGKIEISIRPDLMDEYVESVSMAKFSSNQMVAEYGRALTDEESAIALLKGQFLATGQKGEELFENVLYLAERPREIIVKGEETPKCNLYSQHMFKALWAIKNNPSLYKDIISMFL